MREAFHRLEIHAAIGLAKAYARECIDDTAQAVVTLQAVVPFRWFIAIHLLQEGDPVGALQDGFDFT